MSELAKALAKAQSEFPLLPRSNSPADRFVHYVQPLEMKDDVCWLWDGWLSPDGYGKLPYPGGQLAHRFAYEWMIAPIPAGLVIDHLCRTRHCVNPSHMEVVTRRENSLRGANSLKTHCPKGHPYDKERTTSKGGRHRICSICERESHARSRQRKRAGA